MESTTEAFDPVPSLATDVRVTVGALPRSAVPALDGEWAVGVPVGRSGPVPPELGLEREALAAAGFDGSVGQTLSLPGGPGALTVAVGVGEPGELDANRLRDAAAAYALAVRRHARLASTLDRALPDSPGAAAQAVVEGVLLARYQYLPLRTSTPTAVPVTDLTLLTTAGQEPAVEAGAGRGKVFARAAAVARDLANSPPSLLTAVAMAQCAERLAVQAGLDVNVFDYDDLVKLGCGGLLGVNRGSTDPPRMVKLDYHPASTHPPKASGAPHLTLVGKGVMYDSGGISLKPADAVHATMKNDMSGAAAILAAMTSLAELGCPNAVTGYLMCTDNMPSGSAMKLGDVLTMHGGTTVEVLNTDAEGRLVMADALVLGVEAGTDAIVDIATLTGACLRALGPEVAGVLGNDQALVDQVVAAAGHTDEPVWQLPLDLRYRNQLDSQIADIKNVGGANAGAITAALFLNEFVAGHPWAHLDIAGPAQNDTASGWRPAGCTGFGTRLLLDLALDFHPPGGKSGRSAASRAGSGTAGGAKAGTKAGAKAGTKAGTGSGRK